MTGVETWTRRTLLVGGLGVLLLGPVLAQIADEEPKPEPDTMEPSRKGTLFTDGSDGKIASNAWRNDTTWRTLWIKANATGIHYNINQPAKVQDAVADNWSQVFHLDAPFRGLDLLHFCGPAASFRVWVMDATDETLVYDGVVDGVDRCA